MPSLTSLTSLGLKLSVLRVGQSLASGTASAAHSLAAPAQSPRPAQEAAETPRDSGFNQPTQTLVQEVAAMMQQECLERAEKARGALVKTWQEKANGGQGQGPSRNHFFRLHGQCGRLDEGRRTRLADVIFNHNTCL